MNSLNIGIIAALCSAAAFGSFIAIVPLFYGRGGDPLSIMFVRILVACGFFGIVGSFIKGSFIIPPGWLHRFAVFGFGLGIAGMGLSYLQAVAYIPVSLAVMIFFTWPIITALIAPVLGRSLPGPRQSLCLIGAFICLLPAIGPQLNELQQTRETYIGVAWAVAASLCISTSLHLAHIASDKTTGLTLGFVGSAFAISIITPALWLGGFHFDFSFSQSAWQLVVLLSCLYIVGLGGQIIATARARPEIIGIFYNIEPIVTLFGAYLLLGEQLAVWQYAACGGVIFCLCLYRGFAIIKKPKPIQA